MKKENRLSMINILIIIMTLLFILDRYILFDRSQVDEFSFILLNKEAGAFLKIAIGIVPGKLSSIFGLYSNVFKTYEFWRIFTHIFLHQFLFHLLFNSIALYKVGNIIEKKIGKMKTLLIFLLSGPLSSLIANFIIKSDGFTVGISGSVFAFIGISIVLSLTEKGYTKSNFNKWWIIYFIFYGVILTITSPWTFIAHTSGLLIGVIVGIVLKKTKKVL